MQISRANIIGKRDSFITAGLRLALLHTVEKPQPPFALRHLKALGVESRLLYNDTYLLQIFYYILQLQ